MNQTAIEPKSLRAVNEVFNAEELNALCQRIVSSGVLGRSKNYSALLNYLVQCSIEGKSPKEIEIALDVLGRGDDFDVSTDSTVRVYVHQLRKKLDSYYESYETDAEYRIVIPKGSYTVSVTPIAKPALEPQAIHETHSPFNLNTGLLIMVVALLAVNLIYMLTVNNGEVRQASQIAADHPVWNPVLRDELPILLVMGDYYIFGELNASGNVARMVRDFNVNSRFDLEELQFSDIERAENYLDLDLSYMPEGSAFALAKIVPILQESGKSVNITMMSDLTTSDIRDNHIVYIGYLSALEKLTAMTFAGSGLTIGRSYDELQNTETQEYYTSDAGLPEEGEPFRDYGMFATFPASTETQVVLISGMRDAGLMHTAQALSDIDSLDDLIVAIDDDTDEAIASFEALFEVFGVDRLNFDANLVYANQLDVDQIWGVPQPTLLN